MDKRGKNLLNFSSSSGFLNTAVTISFHSNFFIYLSNMGGLSAANAVGNINYANQFIFDTRQLVLMPFASMLYATISTFEIFIVNFYPPVKVVT